jgi:hypothetical protein
LLLILQIHLLYQLLPLFYYIFYNYILLSNSHIAYYHYFIISLHMKRCTCCFVQVIRTAKPATSKGSLTIRALAYVIKYCAAGSRHLLDSVERCRFQNIKRNCSCWRLGAQLRFLLVTITPNITRQAAARRKTSATSPIFNRASHGLHYRGPPVINLISTTTFSLN